MSPTGSKKDGTPPVKRRCHRCHGSGRAPCQICGGAGQVVMGTTPLGKPQYDRCSGCFGTRTTRCTSCQGDGFI